MSQKIAVVGGGIAGVGAAWALDRAGYEVELFERNEALGGNAKTFRWEFENGTVESPLLVVAWPQRYYHNYELLLKELGVGIQTVPISYFIKNPDGTFRQDGETPLHQKLKPQFRRWTRLVAFVDRVNNFFLGKDKHDSLYHFSYLNPMNLIPLYWLARLFGISKRFWDTIFVPLHASSFITTSMRSIPAVIAPILESIVPLEQPCEMGTWVGPPRQVFERMTASFSERVHTGHDITKVEHRNGRITLTEALGRTYEADKVVFACGAPSAFQALKKPSLSERLLVGRAKYVDHHDATFSKFVVHSDDSIFPETDRKRIGSDFNTYAELDSNGDLECTFVLSSKYPGCNELGHPMLVTFNSKKAIDKIHREINLPHPVHDLSLSNLMIMTMMRYLQGKNGIYYCGSFTTPEGAHDISFLSGLVIAHKIGAAYPLPADNPLALRDFHLMQRMMLGARAARNSVAEIAKQNRAMVTADL